MKENERKLRSLHGQRICDCGCKEFEIFYNSYAKRIEPRPHIEIVCMKCGRTTCVLIEISNAPKRCLNECY